MIQEYFHSFSSPPLDNTVPMNNGNESDLESYDPLQFQNSELHAQIHHPTSSQGYHPVDYV